MYKSTTKCNETLGKWCKNKHGASKIIDTFETYQPSQYHAILGRPAFTNFMAVPHYAYLTLKISGPKGTITVQGSFEVANICDREFNRMAQTFGMIAEYERLKGETDHNLLPDVGRSLPDQAFDTTQDSKKIQVHPTDPNKTTSIAVNMDPT
jgi:hypothetical protein